ncbi:hypothetical protein [Bradyrhizobium sp. LA6.12]|uniref:hypothetical protein n=1 Tax=unclassified Bradyrhizobium TaxID=2631580 RepID=UPI003395D06F
MSGDLYEPPVGPEYLEEASDPREGLDRLPEGKEAGADFRERLLKFCGREVMETLALIKAEAANVGDNDLRYTLSVHMGLIRAIADVSEEARTLILLGRDRRNELETRMLALVEDTARALNKRIQAVEERPTIEYVGVHERGKSYAKGNVVTHGGSAWFAWEGTDASPPGPPWQLMVKHGKDSR